MVVCAGLIVCANEKRKRNPVFQAKVNQSRLIVAILILIVILLEPVDRLIHDPVFL